MVISSVPEIQLSGRERDTEMASTEHTNVRVEPAVRGAVPFAGRAV